MNYGKGDSEIDFFSALAAVIVIAWFVGLFVDLFT